MKTADFPVKLTVRFSGCFGCFGLQGRIVRKSASISSVLLALLCASLSAQNSVDPRHLHERIIAVVPIVGEGTYQDPKRPLFAPGSKEASDAEGIQSFSWQPSDDGKYAIVEFVARDRKAFEGILKDNRTVQAFEKGKAQKVDVERELKRFRKDFSLDITNDAAKRSVNEGARP